MKSPIQRLLKQETPEESQSPIILPRKSVTKSSLRLSLNHQEGNYHRLLRRGSEHQFPRNLRAMKNTLLKR